MPQLTLPRPASAEASKAAQRVVAAAVAQQDLVLSADDLALLESALVQMSGSEEDSGSEGEEEVLLAPQEGPQARLSFDDWCTLRGLVAACPRLHRLLTARAFVQVVSHGAPPTVPDRTATDTLAVDPTTVYRHVATQNLVRWAFWGLHSHANASNSFGAATVSKCGLTAWLSDLYATVHVPARLRDHSTPQQLQKVLSATAVEALLFALNRRLCARVALRDVMRSRAVHRLLEQVVDSDLGPHDMSTSGEESQPANPFAPGRLWDLHHSFTALDHDTRGALTVAQFGQYRGCSPDTPLWLTSAFVARAFETVGARCSAEERQPRLDYPAFVFLALVLECPSLPHALRFLFRCLDLDDRGLVDRRTVAFFYRSVVDALVDQGCPRHQVPPQSHVEAEVLDMLQGSQPGRVTMEDFLASRMGSVAACILFDAYAFLTYEHREAA